jgi:hypothetical protein
VPIDVTLLCDAGDPWPWLRRCPSLARLIGAGTPDSLDVIALVLVEDIYGTRYELAADDEAFLASLNELPPPLLPGNVVREGGNVRAMLGTLRVSFLAWLAQEARRSRSSLMLLYSHERGDYLYETARWMFDSGESLVLADYDGNSAPVWHGSVERRSDAADAPDGLRFQPFAGLGKRKPSE